MEIIHHVFKVVHCCLDLSLQTRKIFFTCKKKTIMQLKDIKTPVSDRLKCIGTLSKDDDDGSENVGRKMNLLSFKLNRVYLDPLNMSNTGDFSWS